MSLADLVAWVMLATLIAWLGVVLWATFRTLEGESRDAVEKRRAGPPGGA